MCPNLYFVIGPKLASLIQAVKLKLLFYYQPRFESVLSELILVKNEAMHAINNLKKWMQPQHVERNLVRLFFFLKVLASVLVPYILTMLLVLFLICKIDLEWTFRLAATKKSIVLPKKLRSYAAVTFWISVALFCPCAHLTTLYVSSNAELYWPQSTSLDECLVVSEPLGVVFIVGNWCSPVQMSLVPLVGAIAAGADTIVNFQWIRYSLQTFWFNICAGNCAIICPSESTAHTAELLHRLIPFYLDNVSSNVTRMIDGCLSTLNPSPRTVELAAFALFKCNINNSENIKYVISVIIFLRNVSRWFLQAQVTCLKLWNLNLTTCSLQVKQKYPNNLKMMRDHSQWTLDFSLLCSGCREEGSRIAVVAARTFTPVTLVLAGKNPCYVDQHCEIATTAQRIAWARFHNAGQSLVAPDYILCHSDVKGRLVQALKCCLMQFYGPDPRESRSYGRMVSLELFNRTRDILWRSGKVAVGGQVVEAEKYIGKHHLHSFTVKTQKPAAKFLSAHYYFSHVWSSHNFEWSDGVGSRHAEGHIWPSSAGAHCQLIRWCNRFY